MLEKEFIPYQESLELAKLGFDEPCLATRDQTEFLHIKGSKKLPRGSMLYDTVDCPTFSQAFRFFRNKYGLNSHIHQENKDNYSYCCGQGYSDEIGGYQDFKTYEEAQLECLKRLIDIAKNGQREIN